MTAKEFRKLALALPDTEEKKHMNHPDFRVGGKIFATLGYPNKEWAMVKLVPGQQEQFVEAEPEVYVPVKGKWGLKGATSVQLKAARKTSVKKALKAAWENQAVRANGRKW
ncbi:MAG TPA: MmcQ/YjbR family DNA-binding protein [Candidatus Acidoferrum sp.]|nr:MmcQ/YjbR family DNA-binding protein [Candidatus Acidoferrum sp.]